MAHFCVDLIVFPPKSQHLAKIQEMLLSKVPRKLWVSHKITEHRCLSQAYIPYFFSELVLNYKVLINLLDKIRQRPGVI